MIDIRDGKKIPNFLRCNIESCFLFDFSYHALFGILIVVHKPSR